MITTRSPDGPGMEQKPRKRYGALIFSMVFLAVAGGIAATVLLANDRKHLRVVLREIGYETRTMVIPKPPPKMEKFKGKRIEGVQVLLPTQMFLPFVPSRDSTFLRTLEKKDGEGLCVMLRKEGFDMTAWAGGAFTPSVMECSYEMSVPNAEKPDDPSTFFMMIKGTPAGDLLSARAKPRPSLPSALPMRSRRLRSTPAGSTSPTGWPRSPRSKPSRSRATASRPDSRGNSPGRAATT
jgi:hypothetical protein